VLILKVVRDRLFSRFASADSKWLSWGGENKKQADASRPRMNRASKSSPRRVSAVLPGEYSRKGATDSQEDFCKIKEKRSELRGKYIRGDLPWV
jgi:hypothetical protein